MFKLGLIGEHISHSLSKRYFDTKFQNENIKNFQYDLYDIDNLKQINELIIQNKIIGLNVTMPYKYVVNFESPLYFLIPTQSPSL